MVHSSNSEGQRERGANSAVVEVTSREGVILGELIVTLMQATRTLEKKNPPPPRYISPATHWAISRTAALAEQQTTRRDIAAWALPVPPPELGAGQAL